MAKYWKALATFAAVWLFAGASASAQPYGGPGPMMGGPGPMMGWHYGPRGYGYYSGVQVERSKVEKAVAASLRKVTIGQRWTMPNGVAMTPMLIDGQVVGQLWQQADPKTLALGTYWAGPWGVNAQLIDNGAVVGMMWVKVQ